MPTTKKETVKMPDAVPAAPEKKKIAYEDELVEVFLFKDSNKYKDDVPVSVNGRTILIKRGEHVMIPRKYAEVLERSLMQDAQTASLIERESASVRKNPAVFG